MQRILSHVRVVGKRPEPGESVTTAAHRTYHCAGRHAATGVLSGTGDGSDAKAPSGALHGPRQPLWPGATGGHRFLEQHAFPTGQHLFRENDVKIVWWGDPDTLDLGIRDEFIHRGVRPAAGVVAS